MAQQPPMRRIYLIPGVFFLILAGIGAVLPLMPTTIFLILAAWCFGRASPRFEAKLLNHPRFGPSLRAWREEGAIPRNGKRAATLGMALGLGIWHLSAPPPLWLSLSTLLVLALTLVWIWTRPSPRAKPLDPSLNSRPSGAASRGGENL